MSKISVPSSAFAPLTIESDVSWLPDLRDCEEPPASTEIYVQAYLADPDKWHWSMDMLNGPRETILKRALAIISRARLPDHEKALSQLGAGCSKT